MARQRDYAAEYARRKARGAAAGMTPSEAAGQRRRQTEAATRKAARAQLRAQRQAMPANRRAATGAPVTGARGFAPPGIDGSVEQLVGRLRGDRRVFVYATVSVNGDRPEQVALYPNGGIRARSLLVELAAAGGMLALIRRGFTGSAPMRGGVSSTRTNRKGSSPRVLLDPSRPAVVDVSQVIVQWTA